MHVARRSRPAPSWSWRRSAANSRIVSSIQKRSPRVAQQALLDERLQDVEVGVADVFGSVERAAAGEDGEAGEELLLVFGEQVV